MDEMATGDHETGDHEEHEATDPDGSSVAHVPGPAEAAGTPSTDPLLSVEPSREAVGPRGGAVSDKRAKRPLIVGAVAVVVVAAVVLGVTLSAGPSGDADAAIVSAVNSAIGQKTAHATLTGSIQVKGQTGELTGSGSYDFSDNAVQLSVNIGVSGQQESLQLIYLGGTVYESLPQIAQVAPGKSWVSVDLSSLQQTLGESGAGQLGADPLAALKALAQQGNTVSSIGPSTINGQSVQGYTVILNPAVEQREMDQASLPASMKRAVFGSGSESVYLDGAGNLVRVTAAITEADGAAGTVQVQESDDLSDYGAPVSIAAPPADEVVPYEQFIQMAKEARTA